jgi:release factor glutamine methyltransferase
LDKSPAALDVARSNAERHEVASRIEFLQSDLLAAVPPQRRFDFVLSNPPYVSRSEFDKLPPEVRNHEPPAALLAGEDGTEVVRDLLPQAAERLNFGGHLLVEISPMIHDPVRELVEADGRFELGPTIKDLARHPRVVQAMRVGG